MKKTEQMPEPAPGQALAGPNPPAGIEGLYQGIVAGSQDDELQLKLSGDSGLVYFRRTPTPMEKNELSKPPPFRALPAAQD